MFVATACISEDIDVSVPETNLVPVELCIEDNATRLDVDGNVVTWEVGDKCSVQFKGLSATPFVTFEITSASQILDNGKRAKFTGMVPEGSYVRAVAFYPGVATGSDNLAMNEHAQQNVFMGAVNDYADALVVAQGKPLTLTMTFEHLLHKIDYKLTGDVNHSNIAVEMVVTSNGNPVDLIQFGGYDMYSGSWSSKATTQSHFTAIEDHNFASEPIASAMVFPFTASNAELLFNVYIDGKKEYAIAKKPSASTFKMSAGKSSTISLALTEDNKVKEESSSGSSVPTIDSDFNPDYYIKTLKYDSSKTRNGIGFVAKGDGFSFDLHVASSYASSTHIDTGEYNFENEIVGYWNNTEKEMLVRNASGLGLSQTKPTGSGGSMNVAKQGDYYIIDIVIVDRYSKTVKVQYIGPLNVDDGGIIPGESGGSSGPVDIELTSLTAKGSTNGCYEFAGVDAEGNKIDLLVNPADATANTLSRGLVEYTSSSYAANEGLFHAKNIVLNGSSRSDVISGMMHVTSASGNNVNLSINLNFSDGTSQRYTFGGAIVTTVVDDSLTLTASKSTITANGSDYVSFTVMQSGVDVTSQCVFYVNGSAILDDVFSTKNAGSYTVYAKKGGVESNHITITAEAVQPIVLSASKTTLVANNSDSVTFTVKQGTTNVSSYAQIWVNGVRNNGTTFTASSAGTYSVYATYDGVTSNTITLTATASDSSNLVTVFAEGVTKTSGWYDVNKKSTTSNPGADAMMCWAAASSNIAQWCQDRYVAAGNTLPAGCPNGTSSSYGYELQIMDVFRDNWDNLARGGWPHSGIVWYFEGRDINKTMDNNNRAYPLSGTGGYFSSRWSTIFAGMHQNSSGGYATEINNYGNWSSSVADPVKSFSQFVIDAFEHGMSGMSVAMSVNFGGAHAVTIWGYELNQATGYITKLYIADSDDGSTPVLQTYTVSLNSGPGSAKIKLSGYTDYYPMALYPISGYGSK